MLFLTRFSLRNIFEDSSASWAWIGNIPQTYLVAADIAGDVLYTGMRKPTSFFIKRIGFAVYLSP